MPCVSIDGIYLDKHIAKEKEPKTIERLKLIDFRFRIQSSNQIKTLYLHFSGFDFD